MADEARKGRLQHDRVTRADSLAAMLRGGKERRLLQPRQDRAPQLRVQLAQPDRTRDQIEQAIPRPEAGQQASVDLGGLIEEEVGERARCDVTAVGTERERGQQQRREAKWLIGRRGRVHDSTDALWQAAGRRVTVLAAGCDRYCPAHRPRRARTLFGRAVGEQPRIRLAGRSSAAPPGGCAVDGDGNAVAVVRRGECTCHAVDLDLDGSERGQREEQRGPCLGEQPPDKPLSRLVPQRQRDRCREALGGRAVRRERQPQHGQVTRPRGQLASQCGNPLDKVAGGAARPGHRTGERTNARLVADRHGGSETHAEPADRHLLRIGPSLAGSTQRGQCRDARRVQRRPYIRGHQRSGTQCQPQSACHPCARRRIRGVLRQLHHHAVPVSAEGVVLLRVSVLTKPRRRRRPGIEHQAAQLRGTERVRVAVLHSLDPPSITMPAYPDRSPQPRARQSGTHRTPAPG